MQYSLQVNKVIPTGWTFAWVQIYFSKVFQNLVLNFNFILMSEKEC